MLTTSLRHTGITWLNNTTVISLDAQKKTVKTHDNQDISGGDEFTAGSKLAQAYQQLFEEQGAEFILNDKVVSVDVDEVGRGKTIHLASGKAVPAERTECCD